MRRGLMSWNRDEVPDEIFAERLSSLRAELKRDGVDALVAYTNIARGAAVWWLTGFTPYWNEGLLYAPMQGDLIFATALSKRVAEWIGSVMPAGKVTTTPRPSALIGEHLGRAGARRIGVLELDDFPAGHAAAILQANADAELVDVTAAFARARAGADVVERRLLHSAERIVETASGAIDLAALDARELIAPAESAARLGGAEECFALVAPDLAAQGVFHRCDLLDELGQSFAVRLSLAYKGAWTRRCRSHARDEKLSGAFSKAEAAMQGFSLEGADLGACLKRHFADLGHITRWTVEQPRGSYPLAPVADSHGRAEGFVPNAPFVLDLELDMNGQRWLATRMFGLD